MYRRPEQTARRWGGSPDRPSHPWGSQPGGAGQPDGADISPWLQERLFDQRIVLLSGPLTASAASRTAAALLALDSLGSEPVRLHMSTSDGDLAAAFAVVDAMEAIRARVEVLVTGQVGGAAVAVLAAAQRRLAYQHASVRICEPSAVPLTGTADEVAAAAGQYLRELEELAQRIAGVTGRARSRVEDDLSAGRVLTATEALEYGLIDEIVGGRP